MMGAIIGDVCGSVYEFNYVKSKEITLLLTGSGFTDDTVMTVAVANAILISKRDKVMFKAQMIRQMRLFGRKYPYAGYGYMFRTWLKQKTPRPYNSFGNGAAMRVSPCGLAAQSLEEALELAKLSAEVTHNHEEGIKGAQATAAAVFQAKEGRSKEDIRSYIQNNFYSLDQTLEQIRPTYGFNPTCQETVPQAVQAFLESKNYEDCLRNAISLGGDSDTLAAIAGSIAWAYYGREGITPDMQKLLERISLPEDLMKVILDFERIYGKIKWMG